ncbi:hypothetical protein ERIC2_c00760 [Paenibacillus larvae subsp. larvae DSM 25430]|uniref:DNA-directed RNA polymerase subunit beta n=3 Tax=Paenibacillus larvae TaxID=1464 RepID=V9VZ68_9BACL|nr:hypothetical protein ERIC2_c00760 [Paenibacillus larvae subsp. larvae DSM 25430]
MSESEETPMPEHNNQPSAKRELNKKRNERDNEPMEEQANGAGEFRALPESCPLESTSENRIASAETEKEHTLSSPRRPKEDKILKQDQASELESQIPVVIAHTTENETYEEPEDAKLPKDKKPAGQRSTASRIAVKTLKILRIPLLCILVLFIGLWIGYSVIGKQPASEIFHIGTWKHIFDLIYQK